MNCCIPKAARGRAAVLKRYETYRNPKDIKAARGRAAIQNISKRREARRTPKDERDIPLQEVA